MARQPALRVAHVVRQFRPAIGGMEEFVEQLAARQVAAGLSVRVITLDKIFDDSSAETLPSHCEHRGIDVVRVGYRGSKRYPIAPAAFKHISDVDIIHVHGVDFFFDYFAATSFGHDKPLILSTHGGFFHTSFAKTLKKVYFNTVTRLSMHRYEGVIACSEQDFDTFAPICGRRLQLIRNPVATAKFARRARRTAKTVIYFGRFDQNKRLDRMLHWFQAMLHSDPQWRLIIAGRPMGISISQLADQIAAYDLEDKVEVHESPSHDELDDLVARASVYCSASEYEGFGLAAVEAAGAGLYPVLSDIPPFRQIAKTIGFGTIVDFSDPSGWADSFVSLRHDLCSFRSQFDEAKIATAVAPYDWEHSAKQFERIYRSVLGEKKRLIGNVSVDVLDRQLAIRRIEDAIERKDRLMVTFCNAHTVNLASHDKSFQQAISSGMVLNDGVGVDIASKMIFGEPFPTNLNGTDFLPQLFEACSEKVRLYLLGGKPGIAEAASRALSKRYPGLAIVGAEHGYFDDVDSDAVVQRASDAGANLILVGMGQPRQENWASRHFQSFNGPVICVGALLDFMSGKVPRAPVKLREMRLEWVYRLWIEPRRLAQRYLVGNLTFLARVAWQKFLKVRM